MREEAIKDFRISVGDLPNCHLYIIDLHLSAPPAAFPPPELEVDNEEADLESMVSSLRSNPAPQSVFATSYNRFIRVLSKDGGVDEAEPKVPPPASGIGTSPSLGSERRRAGDM